MPVDQIIIQIYMQCYIMLNVTIQYHFSENNHVKQINFSLIVVMFSLTFHVEPVYILVQNLMFSFHSS